MNNTMVREIRGAKINPKSSFKKLGYAKSAGAEITRANTVTVSMYTIHPHIIPRGFVAKLIELWMKSVFCSTIPFGLIGS